MAHRFNAAATDPRLSRVRRLAWLLDRSIPIGGGRSIGLDPLIGLLPGGGDAIGVGLSLYVVYEGARLGLPWSVIGRMLCNVALEGVVGTVPLLGDLFDAAWKANVRNLALIEANYQPERAARPVGRMVAVVVVAAVLLLSAIIALSAWVITALVRAIA